MSERQSDIDMLWLDNFDVCTGHGHIITEDLQRAGRTVEEYAQEIGPLAMAVDLGEEPYERYEQTYNEYVGLDPATSMVDRLRPIPAIHLLVETAQAYQIPVGIASNVGRGVFAMMDERHKNGGPRLYPAVRPEFLVLSGDIGLRKPHAEFFQYMANIALLRAGIINPRRMLFVDDQQKNLHGAEEAGLQGYLFDPQQETVGAKEIAGRLGIPFARRIRSAA